MTTFAAPLHVKPWQSDSTVASVNLSGRAFFKGIVEAGPASNTTGQLVIGQSVSLANNSGASGIRLPANATITDITVLVTTSASNTTTGQVIQIGTSADDIRFGQMTVSATRLYRAGVAPNLTSLSAAAWRIGSTPVQLHIDITAAAGSAGDVTTLDGLLTVFYVRGD